MVISIKFWKLNYRILVKILLSLINDNRTKNIEIINWNTQLENESLLLLLNELKDVDSGMMPDEILALLQYSNQAGFSELKEHTSARDLVSDS